MASINAPDYSAPSPLTFNCATLGFVFFDSVKTTQNQMGLYAQHTTWFGNALQVLFGLRHTWIENKADNITRV
ncbi:MAG: hypothetical protein P0107_06390 [Nitrosomonas sp.]|nr:hypothetical protein [Nitrosomonas sp.]MDL1865159.1 hypothetical protein [Betaproteobacteria bacterium PRO5]